MYPITTIMRRVLIAAIAIAIVGAALMVSPVRAHAAVGLCPLNVTCPTAYSKVVRASDNPTYKGWATIDPSPDCALPGRQIRCMIAVMANVPAWQWTNNGWVAKTRATGSKVYVWPYGSGWSWTWTSADGWLAVRSNVVIIEYPHAIPTGMITIGDCRTGPC